MARNSNELNYIIYMIANDYSFHRVIILHMLI